MTPETMRGVMSEIKGGFMKVEKLDVLIPKFSISGSLELVEPLEKLNISQLFGGNSNLTGFLDQYGSEDDTISLHSARPLFHSQFKADHPFLFLIYDKQTDTILFFG